MLCVNMKRYSADAQVSLDQPPRYQLIFNGISAAEKGREAVTNLSRASQPPIYVPEHSSAVEVQARLLCPPAQAFKVSAKL